MKIGCIATFAKTPNLSAVKTRLAQTIGRQKADEIYTACVDCLEETLVEFQKLRTDWDIVWALAEDNAHDQDFWQNREFKKTWTGEGGLGTRLDHIYGTLKNEYENVILIGTDSPQISSLNMTAASNALEKHGAIIGAAMDGGYYLFGGNFKIEQSLWEAVPYSASNTRQEFLKLLDRDVYELGQKTDLDYLEDLPVIVDQMPNVPNAAQIKLIQILQEF